MCRAAQARSRTSRKGAAELFGISEIESVGPRWCFGTYREPGTESQRRVSDVPFPGSRSILANVTARSGKMPPSSAA